MSEVTDKKTALNRYSKKKNLVSLGFFGGHAPSSSRRLERKLQNFIAILNAGE